MKVKDLMSTNIICCSPSTSVLQIAREMKKQDIGVIPVCGDLGNLVGVVTDRDLLLRTFEKDVAKLTSQDVMTLHPVTVSPDTNIHDAALLFSRHKIRRLPVIDNSKLVGLLTLGDLASRPVYIDEAGDALFAICTSSIRQE